MHRFAGQTCGTSTICLNLRSVSDTFEISAQLHPETTSGTFTFKRQEAVTAKKKLQFTNKPCGTTTKYFKLRGVTTTREKGKKVHRFADKLAVPPHIYLIYEVSVTLLKRAPQAHICALI